MERVQEAAILHEVEVRSPRTREKSWEFVKGFVMKDQLMQKFDVDAAVQLRLNLLSSVCIGAVEKVETVALHVAPDMYPVEYVHRLNIDDKCWCYSTIENLR